MENKTFEAVYKKYYQTAFIYTFSLCKSKELTEDIVSTAFEKAYITVNDEKSSFKYWLLVVCKNLWIDYLRKQKKITSSPFETYIDNSETPLEYIIKKEKNKYLYQSILKLQTNYQEVLILHYYGNLTVIEIGKMLSITSTNAKTLLFRARLKLRSLIEEEGHEF